jgi:uncharacterized RDD family membrane protein YckC
MTIVAVCDSVAVSALFRSALPAKVRWSGIGSGLDSKRGIQMQQPPPLPPVNPYAAPAARVLDVSNEADQVLADRGTRLGAAIVDGLIIAGPMILFAIMLPAMVARGSKPNVTVVGIVSIGFFLFFAGVLIVNMVLLHRYGQTMAKRLFKIKIVRGDGSPCSLLRIIFARALPMSLLGAIPIAGPLISLLDPLLIFRDDYRCLHDHIADTLVIKA